MKRRVVCIQVDGEDEAILKNTVLMIETAILEEALLSPCEVTILANTNVDLDNIRPDPEPDPNKPGYTFEARPYDQDEDDED